MEKDADNKKNITKTKAAFAHDRIVHLWWAEMVLEELILERTQKGNNNLDIMIFTLYSTHTTLHVWEKHIPITTALPKRINSIFAYFATHKVFFFSKLFDYRNLMFRFPWLCALLRRKIRKYNPHEIIISSFAAVKNIVPPTEKENSEDNHAWQSFSTKQTHSRLATTNNPTITLYLHSPMQYIWENYDDNIKKLQFPIKQLYQRAASYLRPRDKKERFYDIVLCNSTYTAKLAKQLYNIDGHIRYPSIHQAFIDEPAVDIPKNYFVFVGRVQRFVREIDKIIELCNRFALPLIIMGNWPDMDYARSIAWSTIIFVGHIADTQEKIKIIKYARGLINLAKESFGIATVEWLCLWVPIFGYNAWGTQELVSEKNGMLCDSKEPSALDDMMHQFLAKEFDRKQIAQEIKEKLTKRE